MGRDRRAGGRKGEVEVEGWDEEEKRGGQGAETDGRWKKQRGGLREAGGGGGREERKSKSGQRLGNTIRLPMRALQKKHEPCTCNGGKQCECWELGVFVCWVSLG